jgi:hypothetical protein
VSTVERQIVDGVLYGDDQTVANWWNETFPEECLDGSQKQMLGILTRDGRIGAAVALYRARGRDIEIGVVHSDLMRLASRRALRQVFHYLFTTLGYGRVSAEIRCDNAEAIRFAEGLGFQLECIKRRAADDSSDVASYVLFSENFIYRKD